MDDAADASLCRAGVVVEAEAAELVAAELPSVAS